MLATPGQCGPQHLRNIAKIPQEEFDALKITIPEADQEPVGDDPDEAMFKEINLLMEIVSESELSKKWSGSLLFMKKYVGSAINRITNGPR